MLSLQASGSVNMLKQTSTATNATATANLDTLGYDEVKIQVFLDSAAAVSSNPAVLQLSESDDTVVTNFATFTGSVGDTDFTIPNADTASPQIAEFNVDTRARKRYLRLSVTPAGAAQIVGATAVVGRAESTTTAASNAALVVNI